jgi:hypothetical protein
LKARISGIGLHHGATRGARVRPYVLRRYGDR